MKYLSKVLYKLATENGVFTAIYLSYKDYLGVNNTFCAKHIYLDHKNSSAFVVGFSTIDGVYGDDVNNFVDYRVCRVQKKYTVNKVPYIVIYFDYSEEY